MKSQENKDTQNAKSYQATAPYQSELLEAHGQVMEVKDGFAYVMTQRGAGSSDGSGCSGCDSQKSCGTATLSLLFSPDLNSLLKVENTLLAKAGDQVNLTIDTSDFIRHAMMAYGLPLLGLFVGAGVFQSLFDAWQTELPTIAGGVVGMVSGWLYTRYRYEPQQPIMTDIL